MKKCDLYWHELEDTSILVNNYDDGEHKTLVDENVDPIHEIPGHWTDKDVAVCLDICHMAYRDGFSLGRTLLRKKLQSSIFGEDDEV